MAATITGITPRADGFQIAFNNPGPTGALYLHEVNRSQDFSSDDTLICPGYAEAGANLHDMLGLPNGTPFWIRTRSVEVDPTYSNVVLASTLEVPVAPYGGFSIDKALIVVPAAISFIRDGYDAGSAARPGFPFTNLLRDDPSSTYQATSTAATTSLELLFQTSGEPIDTLAMLGSMAGIDAQIVVAHSPNADYSNGVEEYRGAFRCSPSIGRRRSYHSLVQLLAPSTDRYWYVGVNTPGHHFMARHLIVGLARRSINASRGNGSTLSDLGSASRTRFGAIDRVSGWRGRVVDFGLNWLREAEYHAKYADLAGLVGRTDPVLAVPNSKQNVHLNDRIAFGPITESREETQSGRHYSKSFTIDSIY